MTAARGFKLGVIGAGSMGKNHSRIVNLLAGAKLVFIADPSSEARNSLPDVLKPLAIADYQEKLAEVEAVIIVTPTAAHFEVAQTCLKAGKHVLIEKPVTGEIERAEELAKLAKENNLVLAAGFIERYNPAFQGLQKLLKKMCLPTGREKIIGIDIKRYSPFPSRISDADVISDMMIHDLDLLLAILPNDEIVEIKVEGKKVKTKQWDQVNGAIFFRSGIIAKIAADRDSTGKTRKFVVTTESVLLEADLLDRKLYVRDLITHLPSVHHTKNQDQLTAEIKDFIRAVKKRVPPTASAETAVKALKLAEEVRKKCS